MSKNIHIYRYKLFFSRFFAKSIVLSLLAKSMHFIVEKLNNFICGCENYIYLCHRFEKEIPLNKWVLQSKKKKF